MLLSLFLLTASAADLDPAVLQYGFCVHCHGAHGEGRPELDAPRIGDLSPDYIATQLQAFRDGHRDGQTPRGNGHPKTGFPDDAALQVVAGFAASLDPEYQPTGPRVSGGAALYAACVSCHGADARGADDIPDLLFQDSNYLAKAMRDYRDGRRGGTDAGALAQSMATYAEGLSDDQIDAVVGHIASLRPARPPLEQYEVTLTREEGLAAFADIYDTATHPRCMNCHPDGDAPLHTDDSIPHDFGVNRFSPFNALNCSTCHAAAPVGDGLAPLPPSDPIWSMAPAQMVFENRTPREICEQLKDPELNGGRGHVGSTEHIAHDHLLQTSWYMGRTPPPISHADLIQRFEAWGRAGGPCPEE